MTAPSRASDLYFVQEPVGEIKAGEIGAVEVTKIENKGRQNRRVNIVFAA